MGVFNFFSLSLFLCCFLVQEGWCMEGKEKGKGIQEWPFANDGIVNPPSYYQRYRRDEYPEDKPFFQWWYYYFSDFTNSRYFFLTYCINETEGTGQNYFDLNIGYVDANTGQRWQKTEQFDLTVISIDNYFDLQAKDTEGNIMYSLTAVDNDTYHLAGTMNHTSNVILANNIPEDTVVQFDVTLNRIHGWYGEQDFEKLSIDFTRGEIAWNPYAHNSLIEGKISVGNDVYYYNHSTQFRAYGDMNWGERFPEGPTIEDAVEYPWGWFTANVPNEDPTLDFSLAVGMGKAKETAPVWSMIGAFADFRFNQTHLGVRKITGWDGFPLVVSSSDGEVNSFTSQASNFVQYIDGKYNFSVPLNQSVYISTTHHNITLNYYTTVEKINRLIFGYEGGVFSDFEALGATVHIVIDYIDDNGNPSNLYDFICQNAGLEFGYQTPY